MSIPTCQEEWLDFTFIEQLSQFAVPIRFESEWVVRIDTHYLGGRRHFYSWEIADIGILVIFRKNGKIIRSKIALLQSKRLYPIEQEMDEAEQADYRIGFGRLFEGDVRLLSVTEPRLFSFTNESLYKALIINDEQYKAIESYEQEYKIPVYYMLYHPWNIPHSRELPSSEHYTPSGELKVGCRVISAANLREIVSDKQLSSLKYQDVMDFIPSPKSSSADSPGWRIEEFIVDLLLKCKTGYIATKQTDEGLHRVFNRRSGPIPAAIAITFDAP